MDYIEEQPNMNKISTPLPELNPLPELPARKIPFEFPNDINPHWNEAKPEWSHMVNGASVAMPFLEPILFAPCAAPWTKLNRPSLKKM